MMNKAKSKKWIEGMVLLFPLFLFFVKVPVFVFAFEEDTFFLYEDSFDLSWIHSVEKEEWVETYQMQKEELLLVHTKFKTFGAGVPAVGKHVTIQDGFVQMDVDRSFKELYLTVSSNVRTKLYIGKKTIPLYLLAHDYDTVHIYVDHLHLWELLKGEFL